MTEITATRHDGRQIVYHVETDDIALAQAIADSVVDTIHSLTGHRPRPDRSPIRYTWVWSLLEPEEDPFA